MKNMEIAKALELIKTCYNNLDESRKIYFQCVQKTRESLDNLKTLLDIEIKKPNIQIDDFEIGA